MNDTLDPGDTRLAQPDTLIERLDRLSGLVPFYPLLLAAYPVLRLYSDNVAEVALADLLLPLTIAVGVTAVGLLLLTAIWRDVRRAAILATSIAVPFLVFGYLAESVWPLMSYGPIQQAYAVALAMWVVIVSLSLYVALRIGRRLRPVTQLLNIVSVALVAMASISLVSYGLQTTSAVAPTARALDVVAAGAERESTGSGRDIYHFVFDRYGSGPALRAGLGIDNDEFVRWLRDQGFQVVDDARANHERTLLSLASIFSMDLLDELAVDMGADNPSLAPLIERVRTNPVATLLQEQGYRYIHVGSWYEPTSRSVVADEVIRPVFDVSFASTLRDKSAIGGIGALVTMATSLSLDGSADQRVDATSTQLERLPKLVGEPGPKLVFAHVLIPHGPYLFLADGSIDPERATYKTQLDFANEWIRTMVEPLLALPDEEQPIIILQADEGPYPHRYRGDRDAFDWSKATDEELVAKFGVLNAMYLPGDEGREPLPDGITLVNTYPEILGRYLGLEVPREPDRTFTISDGRHFDLTDVTERLDDAHRSLAQVDG